MIQTTTLVTEDKVKAMSKTSANTQHADTSAKEAVDVRVKEALNAERQITRIASNGKEKKVSLPPIGDRQIISARELWLYCVGEGRPINWIESYKALLKYVSKDYVDIFQPIIKGDNSGTRYYVKVDNIVEFLWRFENNKL